MASAKKVFTAACPRCSCSEALKPLPGPPARSNESSRAARRGQSESPQMALLPCPAAQPPGCHGHSLVPPGPTQVPHVVPSPCTSTRRQAHRRLQHGRGGQCAAGTL